MRWSFTMGGMGDYESTALAGRRAMFEVGVDESSDSERVPQGEFKVCLPNQPFWVLTL